MFQPTLPGSDNTQMIDVTGLASEKSAVLSQLLLRAMSCVDRDQASALALVREASTLLRPVAKAGGTAPAEPSPQGGLAPWQAKRISQYIEAHIGETITLDELARLARLSTSYFSTAFKVTFGSSPHSYVVERRVEFAKQRMITSDAPLCEIALDCGLADQAHLSRVFRRVTGTTPSAWRRYVSGNAAAA